MGDATNAVIIIAGELLKKAEHLLIMGLHPSEITRGYELACKKGLEELESTSAICTALSIVRLNSHSSLKIVAAHTINPNITGDRAYARHCFKTVRLRRYLVFACG
jgi:chaperonin GroEL (HSP60 family)